MERGDDRTKTGTSVQWQEPEVRLDPEGVLGEIIEGALAKMTPEEQTRALDEIKRITAKATKDTA
jgi:hypothetical protein